MDAPPPPSNCNAPQMTETQQSFNAPKMTETQQSFNAPQMMMTEAQHQSFNAPQMMMTEAQHQSFNAPQMMGTQHQNFNAPQMLGPQHQSFNTHQMMGSSQGFSAPQPIGSPQGFNTHQMMGFNAHQMMGPSHGLNVNQMMGSPQGFNHHQVMGPPPGFSAHQVMGPPSGFNAHQVIGSPQGFNIPQMMGSPQSFNALQSVPQNGQLQFHSVPNHHGHAIYGQPHRPPQMMPSIVNVTHIHQHTGTAAPPNVNVAQTLKPQLEGQPDKQLPEGQPHKPVLEGLPSGSSEAPKSAGEYIAKVISIKEVPHEKAAHRNIKQFSESSDEGSQANDGRGLQKSQDSDGSLSSDFEPRRPLAIRWKSEDSESDDPPKKKKKKIVKKRAHAPKVVVEESDPDDPQPSTSSSRTRSQAEKKRPTRSSKKVKRDKSPEYCKVDQEIIVISDEEMDVPVSDMLSQNGKEKENPISDEDSPIPDEECLMCLKDLTFEERAVCCHTDILSTCKAFGCIVCVTKWVAAHKTCFCCREPVLTAHVKACYE